MRTWEDYKRHVKSIDETSRKEMEEIETLAFLVGTMIDQRNKLGLSQKELAELCHIPQSTIGRIESCRTIPSILTLIRILEPLQMKITFTEKTE